MSSPSQLVREHEGIIAVLTTMRLSATVQQLKERSPAETLQNLL